MIKTTVKSRFLGRYPAVNQAEFAEKIGRNPPDQLALSKPQSAHGGPAFLTRVVYACCRLWAFAPPVSYQSVKRDQRSFEDDVVEVESQRFTLASQAEEKPRFDPAQVGFGEIDRILRPLRGKRKGQLMLGRIKKRLVIA